MLGTQDFMLTRNLSAPGNFCGPGHKGRPQTFQFPQTRWYSHRTAEVITHCDLHAFHSTLEFL